MVDVPTTLLYSTRSNQTTATDIQAPSRANTMSQVKIEYPSDFLGLLLTAAGTAWGSVNTNTDMYNDRQVPGTDSVLVFIFCVRLLERHKLHKTLLCMLQKNNEAHSGHRMIL